jgi:hypothetical protein
VITPIPQTPKSCPWCQQPTVLSYVGWGQGGVAVYQCARPECRRYAIPSNPQGLAFWIPVTVTLDSLLNPGYGLVFQVAGEVAQAPRVPPWARDVAAGALFGVTVVSLVALARRLLAA